MAEDAKSFAETLKGNAFNIIVIALLGGGYGLEGFEQSSQSDIQTTLNTKIDALADNQAKSDAKQEKIDDADAVQNSQIQLIIYRLGQLEQ